MIRLPRDELLKIGSLLEDYHACAYKFWEMSGVYYVDDDHPVTTAAVRFVPDSQPQILLNKSFWDPLTPREKCFVICHECLHVLLDHDERNGADVEGSNARVVNVAQDITINEMIVDLFGYDREEIRDWKRFCWIDTCFDHPHTVRRNETFTYYLKMLVDQKREQLPELLDDHSQMSGEGEKKQSDQPGEPDPRQAEEKRRVAGQLAEELSPEELEDVIGAMEEGAKKAGTLAGAYEMILARKVKKLKFKFASLIKKLKRTRVKFTTTDSDSFKLESRRFNDVIHRSGAVLPGNAEVIKPKRDRLLTALFMDVSGSCIEYLKTFEQVFAAFDAEKEIFETWTFIFDTSVTPIEVGQRVRVGGGTNFAIIEEACLELEAQIGKYPDCVVVITDGEGTTVQPKAPKRWVWLLTPKPTYSYIPATSSRHLISEVTF